MQEQQSQQRQMDTAERLREFVLKNAGKMSAQEIAAELNVSILIVQLFYPNKSR